MSRARQNFASLTHGEDKTLTLTLSQREREKKRAIVSLKWAANLAVMAAACLTLAATTAGAAESADARKSAGLILFRNGDRLTGSLQSIDGIKGIRWRNTEAFQPIEFDPDKVSEIHFGASAEAQRENATNNCEVRLVTQDQLQGTLREFDGEKLVLETWYAGTLEFPRRMLQSISPVSNNRTSIFEGPEGLEGWTMGKVSAPTVDAGEWKYKDGAFYAGRSASIARDVKLPDLASIQFDFAWRGFFHLAIALYTDYLHPVNLANKETEPDFGGFYSLQLNTFTANLLPIKKHDPLRYLGQAALPAFQQRNSAHVDIRVNKQKRSIALLIDGVLIKEWTDTEEFAGRGTAVRFVHQGQGAVRISNIKVTDWDGQYEERFVAPAPLKNDLARLRNGDKVNGALEAIRDNKVTMSGSGPKLDIPWRRVRQIDFAAPAPGATNKIENMVRAYFVDGGSFSFRLERFDDQSLVGENNALGKIAIKPHALLRLEFDNSKTP